MLEYLSVGIILIVLIKMVMKWLNNIGTFAFGLGSVDLKSYGRWAVVTGCTEGIGKSFAEELAQRGLNLVLISHHLDDLKILAQSLRKEYSIDVKYILADFRGTYI